MHIRWSAIICLWRDDMKVVAIIPARYKSSRFEGKPLADIKGKPMIWWVYNQAQKVKEISDVYVATDDQRIYDVCKKYKMNVCMTSEDNLTGTDRVAEVAEKIEADIYVNIQGDEPLIEPNIIKEAITPLLVNPSIGVTNLMSEITCTVDIVNTTIPKVVTNEDNYGLFLSRAAMPYPKGSLEVSYYKQICVYGYRPDELRFFRKYGLKHGKAKIEKIEDIELMRFIECSHPVKFIEVSSKSVAVDTPKDLKRVIDVLEEMQQNEAN